MITSANILSLFPLDQGPNITPMGWFDFILSFGKHLR